MKPRPLATGASRTEGGVEWYALLGLVRLRLLLLLDRLLPDFAAKPIGVRRCLCRKFFKLRGVVVEVVVASLERQRV
jgi:hypothetical protein